jgi:hypothetical protein
LEIRDKKCKDHLLPHRQASVLHARCILDVLLPYAKITFQMQMCVLTAECRGPKKSLLPMPDEIVKHGSAPASFSSLREFTTELKSFPPVYYPKLRFLQNIFTCSNSSYRPLSNTTLYSTAKSRTSGWQRDTKVWLSSAVGCLMI